MAAREILLLGDGSHFFQTIGWVLEYKGYDVNTVSSPEAALEALVKKNYDLVMAGVTAKPWDGLEVVKRARKLDPEVKVMLLSDRQGTAFPLEAYEMEVDDYLFLPLGPIELWRRVSRCLAEEVLDLQPVQVAPPPVGGGREKMVNRLASMMHDIRGSLVSTAAGLKLLAREGQGEADGKVQIKLEKIWQQVEKSLHLTEEFMTQVMGRPGLGKGLTEALDLHQDVIAPVLAELNEEIQEQRIKLDDRLASRSQGAIAIKGSKLWLKSVFRNLMTNGIKHGGPGCTIIIDWEQRGADGLLHVYNSGCVIPQEYSGLLFSNPQANPRKAGRERRGMGLGLYLSRDIVRSYGGEMWYEPRPEGANFVVSLPA